MTSAKSKYECIKQEKCSHAEKKQICHLTSCFLQTCCHKFLNSFFLIGLTRKSAAPLSMHLKTMLTESCEDIIITGMFLDASCSMIVDNRRNPDIKGSSTSVKTRSMLNDFSFSMSHAFTPSEAAATA
jgi:hypothetical protein